LVEDSTTEATPSSGTLASNTSRTARCTRARTISVSERSSPAYSSSSLPAVDCTIAARSVMCGTACFSPSLSARRTAFATSVSKFAIDMRTETPEAWFTSGLERA
jgi:hypothetical protein